MESRIQSRSDIAAVLLFCLALILPALVQVATGRSDAARQEEQRTLAPLPVLPDSAAAWMQWPRAWEAWHADRFGMRQSLIRLHSHLLYFGLGMSPSPKVIRGDDGWLFLKGVPDIDGDPITDYRGTMPLTPFQLERWRWQLEDQRVWLQQQDVKYLYAVVPGKPSLYADHLPAHIRPYGKQSALEQFMDYMDRHLSFSVLNLTGPMQERGRTHVTYRKTDTHWNDDGALAGAIALTDRIYRDYPDASFPGFDAWNRRSFRYTEGDLARLVGLPGRVYEVLEELTPRRPRARVTPLRDHPLADIVAEVDDPMLPRAVLFHDSFGQYIKPILVEGFRWIRFRWTNLGIETGLVRESAPDVAIQMMGERRIRLGQRYPIEVQQAGNEDRFAASDDVALTSADAALRALNPDVIFDDAGIDVSNTGMLQIPWLPAFATHLAVVGIEVESDRETSISLFWDTQHEDTWMSFQRREVKADLVAGIQRVFLPVLDPETVGAVQIRFPAGQVQVIRSLEVRLVPRDPSSIAGMQANFERGHDGSSS